jgi:hypothetical protein
MKTCISVIIVCLALLFAPRAHAQITPNSVAPPISFCIGQTTTCVMPDFNLQVVNYDLTTKKWSGGVTAIGAGYELLFFSDQPWASGIALHGAGQFTQAGPNYFAITPTVVVAKYFEIGGTFTLMDGSIGKSITLGLGIPFDVVTGATMQTRLANARRAAGAAQ